MNVQDDPADAMYYEAHAQMLANLCREALNVEIDLDYLESTTRYAESMGPILDPTAYRDGGAKNVRDMQRMVKAMKAFRSEVQAIAERES